MLLPRAEKEDPLNSKQPQVETSTHWLLFAVQEGAPHTCNILLKRATGQRA